MPMHQPEFSGGVQGRSLKSRLDLTPDAEIVPLFLLRHVTAWIMERKLGKLRQWAGEVVSSNKTTFTEEFKDLESQIDLRRSG